MQIVGQDNGWRVFQNEHFGEKISLMKKVASSLTILDCKTSNLKVIVKKRGGLNENLADIKFEVTNCSPTTGRRVCDVVISSSNNLEWTNGFKPKVGFCDPVHHPEI